MCHARAYARKRANTSAYAIVVTAIGGTTRARHTLQSSRRLARPRYTTLQTRTTPGKLTTACAPNTGTPRLQHAGNITNV